MIQYWCQLKLQALKPPSFNQIAHKINSWESLINLSYKRTIFKMVSELPLVNNIVGVCFGPKPDNHHRLSKLSKWIVRIIMIDCIFNEWLGAIEICIDDNKIFTYHVNTTDMTYCKRSMFVNRKCRSTVSAQVLDCCSFHTKKLLTVWIIFSQVKAFIIQT